MQRSELLGSMCYQKPHGSKLELGSKSKTTRFEIRTWFKIYRVEENLPVGIVIDQQLSFDAFKTNSVQSSMVPDERKIV